MPATGVGGALNNNSSKCLNTIPEESRCRTREYLVSAKACNKDTAGAFSAIILR